jgi:hypothetical protein
MTADERFFAWLDGELPPAEAEAMARRVADDPELRRLADAHRALGDGLRGAFDGVAAQPVPAVLVAAAAGASNVASLDRARAKRDRQAAPLWRQAVGLAATLALGVALGSQFAAADGPLALEGGRMVAGADLEQALYAQFASAPAAEGPRIGMTFRDRSGAICRTFQHRAADGLACREGGDWRIRALLQTPEGAQGEYRMAAGADPRLMEIVEQSITGEPFDAAQERDAKSRNWR